MNTLSNVLDFLNVTDDSFTAALNQIPLTDIQLHKLIEPEPSYGLTLRVLMLRVLLYTPAIEQFKRNASFSIEQACEFLGIENYQPLVASTDRVSLRRALEEVLREWESLLGTNFVFPTYLVKNLNKLSEIIDLNQAEKTILGFFILLHAEDVLSDCCDIVGSNLNEFSFARNLAPVLGMDVRDINALLSSESTLRRSGLIYFNLDNMCTMRYCVDMITPMFVSLMLKEQQDMRDLLQSIVIRTAQGHLSVADYVHVEGRLDAVKTYLKHAIENKLVGVNILMYGCPGTGKTQFAKLVSHELGCEMMEIGVSDEHGDPVPPIRRLRSYRLVQPFFKQGETVVMFDECEEVFDDSSTHNSVNGKHTLVAKKSWINLILDTNSLPAIWIANSIKDLDPAYIRRFSMCFEMPIPPEAQRKHLLTNLCEGVVSEAMIAQIAKSSAISPALATKTVDVLKVIGKDKDESERNGLALQLINDKLRTQGVKEVKPLSEETNAESKFRPEMVNCETNLTEILDGIRESGQGRLCFFGPPGTGKTEAGKWLAKNLDVPHLVYKASDLLAPFVGESEQNIAAAFARASAKNAVLQFDEVDSYLSQRQQSRQNWTVTMVNQILTEIDSFEGIFVASTNRFDNLDEAALRRFDLCLKFDFMLAQQAWELFKLTCAELQLEVSDELLQSKVQQLKNLTPGDFAQVVRQAKYVKQNSPAKVFDALKKAASLKKSTTYPPMGFVHAA